VAYFIPEHELLFWILQVDMLARKSCQVKKNILSRVVEQGFIAVVDFGQGFLKKQGPDLYFSIIVFNYPHKCRDMDVSLLHNRNVVINKHIFPYAVMIDPQIIDAKAEHLLLLKNTLKTSVTVCKRVHGDCHVVAIGNWAKVEVAF